MSSWNLQEKCGSSFAGLVKFASYCVANCALADKKLLIKTALETDCTLFCVIILAVCVNFELGFSLVYSYFSRLWKRFEWASYTF